MRGGRCECTPCCGLSLAASWCPGPLSEVGGTVSAAPRHMEDEPPFQAAAGAALACVLSMGLDSKRAKPEAAVLESEASGRREPRAHPPPERESGRGSHVGPQCGWPQAGCGQTVTARSRPGVSEPCPRAQQAQSLSRASQRRFGVCVLSPSVGTSWGAAARGVRRGTGLPGKGGGMELGVSDGVLFPLFQGAPHPPWLLGPGPAHTAEMRSWGSS